MMETLAAPRVAERLDADLVATLALRPETPISDVSTSTSSPNAVGGVGLLVLLLSAPKPRKAR
jgi:hypothetical protein